MIVAKRLICVVFLAAMHTGCGKDEPPRSGGRTASYWAEVLQKPDGNVELRRKAAVKLGPLLLLDPAAQPALLDALKDPDAEVRSSAARSLGIYAGPKAAELLPTLRQVAQQDADPKVRSAAAEAVGKLEQAVP
jgi:HEAT repeat protein